MSLVAALLSGCNSSTVKAAEVGCGQPYFATGGPIFTVATANKYFMRTIKVPFDGKGYKVQYKVETIDMSMTPVSFLNVYAIFVDDPVLQKIVGEHFTILHNPTATVMPLFDINTPGDIVERNLKKDIAQQILNEPSQ